MPVLGDQFGEVLERGELTLVREGGAFFVKYWEHCFPVTPRQVPRLLGHRLDTLRAELGPGDVNLQELESILTALEKLAPRDEVSPDAVAERAREKEVAKRRLAALFEASPRIAAFVDENVRIYNGTPGDARSFDLLDELLDHQAYRLAHWRVAGEEINYRRFFDINTLAAIRMEDERVFRDTHQLVFRLVDEGKVTGLRIDHPDGLYAPSGYFRRLQQEHEGLYVVVEKILEGHEKMPASWQVDGTTGYEWLNTVNGLFVDARQAGAFAEIYARFTGIRQKWSELINEKKRVLMRSSMASEINMLSHRLNRLSEGNRRTRDFTLNALTGALVDYVARLPIYRTYVEGYDAASVDERDRQYIESTIRAAKRSSRELNRTIYDFLRSILLLENPTDESREFVRKLQQVTGPVTAKAIEDTAFYVYNRLVSLNEVGGDPQRFGVSVEEFHRDNAERLAQWPGSLNTTATHDTKRGEDVRLRIDALSEIPGEWEQRLQRWAGLAASFKTNYDGELAPDANDELLVYQTLVGSFPDDGKITDEYRARIAQYLEKALKEAKVHSSWTNPDEEYEKATREFAQRAVVVAAVSGGLRAVRTSHRGGGAAVVAGAGGAQDRGARRPRRVSRVRAVGSVARRSGQSAACRLRAAPAPARRDRAAHQRRRRVAAAAGARGLAAGGARRRARQAPVVARGAALPPRARAAVSRGTVRAARRRWARRGTRRCAFAAARRRTAGVHRAAPDAGARRPRRRGHAADRRARHAARRSARAARGHRYRPPLRERRRDAHAAIGARRFSGRAARLVAMIDASGAQAALAAPVDATLFFAGEASNAEGASGTVHGAIATGVRAADEILGH